MSDKPRYSEIISAHMQRTKSRERNEQASEPEPEHHPSPVQAASEPRRRRTPGKRSNPEYELVSAYIRSDTYRDVQIRLLQAGRKKEFSDLVEELLADWLTR